MKILFSLMALLGIGLSFAVSEAQSPSRIAFTVAFDEALMGDYCSAAINAYQPDLVALDLPDSDFGPPYIIEEAEASGIAPECEFGPGAGIRILLNRLATHVRFNRYGTAAVTLLRNGVIVGRVDNTSGLGGRYERGENNGFDEIILTEATRAAPLRLDELEITLLGEAITLLFDFENGVDGEACSATFAPFNPLLSVEGEATLRHGANSQECAFDSLSLLLNQPASHVGFRTTGNADLLLGLNGSQNRYPLADAGYFHAVRPAGLDALILQGNNGQALVGLDELRLSFTVKTALIRQDFSQGETCNAALTSLGISSQSDSPIPITASREAGGALGECVLAANTPLHLSLAQSSQALSFRYAGAGELSLMQAGTVVLETALSGSEAYFGYWGETPFTEVILRPVGESDFYLDNLVVVAAE